MSNLRDQLAKHDGCSRWGLEDAAAIKSCADRLEALEKAAQDFIGKVDRGEARSVRSYAQFKAALAIGVTP